MPDLLFSTASATASFPTFRGVVIVPVVALLLASALSGCGSNTATASPMGAGGPPPVSVAVVLERPIVETQEFSGRLEAVEHADIRPRVAGYLDAVRFRAGAEVRKGDVLFVVDPRPYQAEAARADAAAASSRAKADLAKTEVERARKLLADNAIAQRDYDQRAASARELDATASADAASARVARLNLEFTEVRAPISGRVSKAEVTVGNLVDSNTLLTSIVSNNPIYASFDGDESTFLRLGGTSAMAARATTPVQVEVGLADETGYGHHGKLEFVDNRIDPATGSVRMRAVLDNADGKLAAGLFARIRVGGGAAAARNSILIADRAVGTDQNRKFVLVASVDEKSADKSQYKAEYRPVQLGPVQDGLRVVRSGLKPGDRIVVDGLQRVRPGAPLTPQVVSMDANPDAPAKADAAKQ